MMQEKEIEIRFSTNFLCVLIPFQKLASIFMTDWMTQLF